MKVLVADAGAGHAATMTAIIQAECPTATIEDTSSGIAAAIIYAIENGFDIISSSLTGLTDARNEGGGDTAWAGGGDGEYGTSTYGSSTYINRVGIVHSFGDGTNTEFTEPSRLDIICAVAHEDGSHGAGLEIQTDDSSTSAATARVAGVIAQILVDNPTWNFHDARQAIRQTCSNYSTGWVKETGYGTMDKTAAKAVTSLEPMSPTRISVSNSSNVLTLSWVNPKDSANASTVISIYDEEPASDVEPVGFYDSTGTSDTETIYGKAGTYYIVFQGKNSNGDYSQVESFDYETVTLVDNWESNQQLYLDYLKDLIDNIQRYERDIFGYVDYLTEDNVVKIGNRYPAVLIKDGNEEWEEAGGYRYDVGHFVDLYMFHNINQDRLERINEDQKAICDTIIDDGDLGGYAYCARIINVDKGDYYSGAFDPTRAGYNDNYSLRIISLRIQERING